MLLSPSQIPSLSVEITTLSPAQNKGLSAKRVFCERDQVSCELSGIDGVHIKPDHTFALEGRLSQRLHDIGIMEGISPLLTHFQGSNSVEKKRTNYTGKTGSGGYKCNGGDT